jgi:orotate phosphoribosyltransferase-like protein
MKNIPHFEWAAESYKNGASLEHIASVLDCNTHTLRYRLKKTGTEMRGRGVSGRSKINDKRFAKGSIEKIRVFLDQRSKGVNVEDIVSELKVTRQAIYALFKAGNFILPKEKDDEEDVVTSNKATEVMSLFLIHEDLHYVSYLLDMDMDEVREILRSKDIEVPHVRKEKVIGFDQYKKIFRMRKNGKTIADIAEEYDVSLMTISRVIKDIEALIEETI